MFLKIIIAGLFLLLILISCSENAKKKTQDEQQITAVKEPPRVKTEKEVIERPELSEEIGNIGVIEKLTPELFVKITILYRRENKKWLEQSQSLSLDEQRKFIDEANKRFFLSFGITEEEYVSYSQNNIDELNTYMEEHPELLPQVMEY